MVSMALPRLWGAQDEGDSDLYLVERALAADLAAFEQLVAKYQNRLTGYAARMVNGDREEAEDIAQETFIRAYKSLDSFRGQSSFSTWIYKIASNLCIDRSRSRARRPQQAYSLDEPMDDEESGAAHEIPDSRYEPAARVERDELAVQVREMVAAMPLKSRQVLVMCDLEGRPYEEASRLLGVPLGTVKSRLFHARSDLARRLRPYLSGNK
jgi:RNA polymerase sigma-70 factor (ECF subfamily)